MESFLVLGGWGGVAFFRDKLAAMTPRAFGSAVESSDLRSSSRAMEVGSKTTSSEGLRLKSWWGWWWRPFLAFFMGGERVAMAATAVELLVAAAALLSVVERLVGRDMKVIRRALWVKPGKRKKKKKMKVGEAYRLMRSWMGEIHSRHLFFFFLSSFFFWDLLSCVFRVKI